MSALSGDTLVAMNQENPAARPARLAALLVLTFVALATPDLAAAPPFTGAGAFIQKNCAACHNSTAPAAHLDLIKLSWEPANPDNFATWVKVHDRVAA
ncbi:MAG TPA: hypothetical protein VLJ39_16160, partial [Tepidisphaeraceae bacterium]|nr:hypothetical protein [Tepidisphaeraceae bacterium]